MTDAVAKPSFNAGTNISRNNKRFYFVFSGLLMGMADIIPGVSGGTMAIIMGIYERLVTAISRFDGKAIRLLIKGDLSKLAKHIDLGFLAQLGTGIVCAVIIFSRIIHFLLHDYSLQLWGLFTGVILSSAILLCRKEFQSKFNLFSGLPLVIGTLIAYFLVTLFPIQLEANLGNLFFAGMVAIVAMILPGISGSFILLIIGMYPTIIGYLKNPFGPGSLTGIIVFGTGAALGLIFFSKILKFFIKSHGATMNIFFSGFMLGSIRKLWPWRTVEEVEFIGKKLLVTSDYLFMPVFDKSQDFIVLGCIVLGFCLVFIPDFVQSKHPNAPQ